MGYTAPMNSIERALGKILGTTNKEIEKPANVDDTSIPGPTRQERAMQDYTDAMQEVREAQRAVAASMDEVTEEQARHTADTGMRQAHHLQEGFTKEEQK